MEGVFSKKSLHGALEAATKGITTKSVSNPGSERDALVGAGQLPVVIAVNRFWSQQGECGVWECLAMHAGHLTKVAHGQITNNHQRLFGVCCPTSIHYSHKDARL